MKKIIALTFFVAALAFSAQAQFKFGAGAQLLLGTPSAFGVGVKGHYTINDDWAAQGSFHYQFEEFTYITVDLDAHYKGLSSEVEGFAIAPFAGLQISSFSVLGIGVTDTNLNLGVNGTLPLDGGLSVYIEPKIVIGGGSGFVIGGGVYF